jgi:hypothetical protein
MGSRESACLAPLWSMQVAGDLITFF